MRNRMGIVRVALALAVGIAVVSGVCGAALAAQTNEIALSLEGKALGTVGKLISDTTLVSLEDISTDLGLTYWGPRDSQAVVTYKDKKVTFNLGSNWTVVNGHEVLCPWTPTQEGDQVMVPLRFLMENLGFRVKWVDGPANSIDIRPVVENSLIIGTVRERQETGTLQIDVQYPKIVGLDLTVQEPMNAFFANRTSPAVEEGCASEKTNIETGELRWPTQVVLNYRVAYNQKDLLSIVFDDYLFTGGAHGITGRHGYTADIKTGVSYALKDLFLPGTDYVSLLSAEVQEQIEEKELATLGTFTKIRDDQDFYLYDDNLIVYFQQYELMAYAFGFPEFKIPMASLKDVLIPEMAARNWVPAE